MPSPLPRPGIRLLVPGFAAVVGYATVAQGAFYAPETFVVAAILLLLVLGGGNPRGMGAELLAFSILAVGLLVAALAAGWPVETWFPVSELVTGAGAFIVVRTLALRGERVEVLEILAWVGAAVGLLGFVGVAFHLDSLALEATELRRASSTLTYANAAAAFLALCLPAAALLPHLRRPPARLAAFALITGLLVTLSRGGIAAAILLVVVAAALGAGPALRQLLRPLAGAAVAAASALPSIVGDAPRPLPALLGLAAGAAIAAVPARRPERPGRGVSLGMTLGVTLAAVVLVALASGSGLDRFLHSRIAPAAEGRFANWSRTLETALEDPWFGGGPGSFRQEASRAAHSEYLQTLAETGIVGLASVLAALGLFAWRLGAARPPRDPVWALGAAACVAFAVHSAVDFLWRFPLLLMAAFAWLAIAITPALVEEPAEPLR